MTDGFTFKAFLDLLAAVTLGGSVFFMVVGALGVVRLPDAYNRIHAASICITLGLTGMLLAACYHIGTLPIIAKALVTIVFTFVAMPIGSHLLAKAAHHGKLPQWPRTLSDELADDKADPTLSVTDDVLDTEHSSNDAAEPRGAAHAPLGADASELRRAQSEELTAF